jgi:hypothetical protein
MTSFADRARDRYEPPNGNHRVVINRAWAGRTGAGKEKATIGLEILDGAERGNEFTHWLDLDAGYGFAERALTMYGLPLAVLEADDDLERLSRDLQPLIGTVCWVTVSRNQGGFVNVTVDGAQTQIADVDVDGPRPASFEQAAAAASGDDEPIPW